MGTSRGLAGRAGLVTQGYGGPIAAVIEGLRRLRHLGAAGTKRAIKELEHIIVWAKLVRVNAEPPPVEIQGFVRVGVSRARSYAVALVEHISTRVRRAVESIVVTVRRLR
jgi:hypothetical protein